MTKTAIASSDPRVDAYIKKHKQWQDALESLRKILLGCGLDETIKWGAPAYTWEDRLVVGLAAFKNHCALWFHQGVFLKDKQKQLVNAQDGRTRAMRQWRFVEDTRIDTQLVKAYVREAIANEQEGKKIKPEPKTLVMPGELAQALQKNRPLQKAFAALTPGKQREYAEHIGSAKQEKTRKSRLEKATPMIIACVGLHDKYRQG